MIDPIPDVEASALIASSCSVWPRSSANAASASTRSKRSSSIVAAREPRPSGRRLASPVLPGQEAAREREVRDVGDAELATERQHCLVVGALEQAVVVLEHREARGAELASDTVRLRELLAEKFEHPIARTLPPRTSSSSAPSVSAIGVDGVGLCW